LIVLDTSALVAITNHEPERARFLEILAGEDRCLISAVTLFETRMVIQGRFDRAGLDRFAEWMELVPLEVIPFDADQVDAAFAAFVKYGKGISPARLNLCDCVAYALAKGMNAPLLFKGNDFTATDVIPAAAP
jgi:ribonuclease VapC